MQQRIESGVQEVAMAFNQPSPEPDPGQRTEAVESPAPSSEATPADPRVGGRALEQIAELLRNIDVDALLEPKVQLSSVLEEARELHETLARQAVRDRMRGVGVSDSACEELGTIITALAESERRWCAARDAHKTARQAQAEAFGYALRDEMVAACRFHLDGVEVLELLARVTDGENARDLVQDLRELATFLCEHAPAFAKDCTFDALACAEEASELASAVALELEPEPIALEQLELRDRAFTLLCDRVQQLRLAGAYAYRGTLEARRFFASSTVPARRRRPLPSAVRALAG